LTGEWKSFKIIAMDLPVDSGDSSDLVERCLAGEPEATELFYNQNARAVMVYFLRSGFVQAQAEDLTQEVFLRAIRSLGTYDPARGGLRNWLWTIARNLARRQWSRRRGTVEQDLDLAEVALDGRDGPAEALAATEETRAVAQCVQALRGELANLVRMRYVDGLTTRGIAELTQTPEATVRARLTEALNLVERCLKSKGFIKT
jgi:RNA polymerase sigma-70 factor (ECF subfamily)